MNSKRAPALIVFVFLSIPFLVASADSASSSPGPSASASVAPPKHPISASIFAGTSKAPAEEAWKDAVEVTGIRMGADAERHSCRVKHIGEWVRIECNDMRAARVDILAGEKRDFTVIGSSEGWHGENMKAQFSMHSGDRRIIQWIMSDTWSTVWPGDNPGEWMSGGPENQGPMLGVAVQVDWAAGPDPIISIF
jgi:hypothetical protein